MRRARVSMAYDVFSTCAVMVFTPACRRVVCSTLFVTSCDTDLLPEHVVFVVFEVNVDVLHRLHKNTEIREEKVVSRAVDVVTTMVEEHGDFGARRVRSTLASGRIRVVNGEQRGGNRAPVAACAPCSRRCLASRRSLTGCAAWDNLLSFSESTNTCQEGAASSTYGGFTGIMHPPPPPGPHHARPLGVF